ncbi:MAG: hypothetical protein E4H43_03315 [Bacteroidia bacterium]|nr:MAG: hypothetical protein E4H43_03315 [Bacteroidia bacterium]
MTDRCWHLLSGLRRRVDDPELRNRFLNLLAKHNAIVLCAHLHRYAVACRVTDSGTVVQVMVNSVNRGFNIMPPATLQTLYKGSGFVDDNPDFQPATQNARRRILDNEKKFVNYFQSGDVPGYALITIREKDNTVNLSYYNGFSVTPYQIINLTDLQKLKDDN